MGLIKDVIGAAMSAGSSAVNSSIWKEYFVSGDMSKNVLMTRAQKVTNGKDVNNKADANLISSGALVDIQAGQCAIIVENGKVLEFVAEPGRYTWDATSAPSLLCGTNKGLKAVAQNFLEQFSTGGVRTSTQRLYFVNTGAIWEPVLWGSGSITFDSWVGQHPDGSPKTYQVTIQSHGSIRLRIDNPVAFYNEFGAQLAGGDNLAKITTESIEDTILKTAKGQIKQAVTVAISNLGRAKSVRYTDIASYSFDIEDMVYQYMSKKTLCQSGFAFSDFVIEELNIPENDKKAINEFQAELNRSSGTIADQAYRMKMAESFGKIGEGEGSMGIIGMGMMLNSPMAAGFGVTAPGMVNPNQQMQPGMQQPMQQPMPSINGYGATGPSIYGQPQPTPPTPQPTPTAPTGNTWTCSCGHQNTGKFCMECGAKQPEPVAAGSWTCSCGKVNTGKFCPDCGSKKPEAKKVLKCDKCGWVAPEGTVTKFCPECGDPVTEADFQ